MTKRVMIAICCAALCSLFVIGGWSGTAIAHNAFADSRPLWQYISFNMIREFALCNLMVLQLIHRVTSGRVYYAYRFGNNLARIHEHIYVGLRYHRLPVNTY